jgi:hypothetical protein
MTPPTASRLDDDVELDLALIFSDENPSMAVV